jgi:hypothetical protein
MPTSLHPYKIRRVARWRGPPVVSVKTRRQARQTARSSPYRGRSPSPLPSMDGQFRRSNRNRHGCAHGAFGDPDDALWLSHTAARRRDASKRPQRREKTEAVAALPSTGAKCRAATISCSMRLCSPLRLLSVAPGGRGRDIRHLRYSLPPTCTSLPPTPIVYAATARHFGHLKFSRFGGVQVSCGAIAIGQAPQLGHRMRTSSANWVIPLNRGGAANVPPDRPGAGRWRLLPNKRVSALPRRVGN